MAQVVKNPPAKAEGTKDTGLIPWSRAQQPTPVVLPRESHAQRSLGRLQSIESKKVGHNCHLHFQVTYLVLYVYVRVSLCFTLKW